MAGKLSQKLASIFHGRSKSDPAYAVEQRYLESHYLRRRLEGVWFTNLAFYRGNQWVTWNNKERRLTVKAVPRWRTRMVVNRVLPTCRAMLGITVRNKPTEAAVPSYSGEMPEMAARAGTAFLHHQHREQRLYRKKLMARLWALNAGRSYLSCLWNPDSGKTAEIVDLQEYAEWRRARDEAGERGDSFEAALPMKKTMAGTIEVDVVSPFALHVDPTALSLHDARWAMMVTHIHRDDIREMFGSDAAAKVTPDSSVDYKNYERRLLFDFGQIAYPSEELANLVVLKEIWERPTNHSPDGRYMVVAGGHTMKEDENIYRELPFVSYGCYPSPGSFYDEALTTHIRPLQVEANKSRSSFRDIANLMGKPKWFAWRGSGLLDAAIDDQPGEIVEVDDMAASFPQRIDPPPPPQHFVELESMAWRDMDVISGVNDAMRGHPPEGVKSGKGLAVLQEGGMAAQSILVEDQKEGDRDLAIMQIKRAKQFYDTERLVHIVGRDNEPEVHAFSAARAELCLDVHIENAGAFPSNRIAKMEFAMEMWVQGLIVNKDGQRDPKRALDILEFGDVESLFGGSDTADKKWAQRENQLATEGQQLEVKAYENHYLHADEHRGHLLSAAGRDMEPAARQHLEQHLDEHIQNIMISENATRMQLARPPVGGGAGGEAVDPSSMPMPGGNVAPNEVVDRSGGQNAPKGMANQTAVGPPGTGA